MRAHHELHRNVRHAIAFFVHVYILGYECDNAGFILERANRPRFSFDCFSGVLNFNSHELSHDSALGAMSTMRNFDSG